MKSNPKFTRMFPALRHMNLPNALTTLGLVFGIFACFFLTRADLRTAIVFIFLAGLMDLIDGYVAAKLDRQTEFGMYVDTLVDFFTCGVLPIWMVFYFLVENVLLDNILIIGALIFYCVCALWRLAYYNIIEAKEFFTGLPVPGAMMMVTIAVWGVVTHSLPIWTSVVMFIAIGLLMISGIHLKKYGMWQKVMGVASVVFLLIVVFGG